MRITLDTPESISFADSIVEKLGFDPYLFDILVKECTDVVVDDVEEKIYAYTTVWDYEEPYSIYDNDDLLRTVKEIIATTYAGIEDFMPEEYADILGIEI